jgi:hypothetical protein
MEDGGEGDYCGGDKLENMEEDSIDLDLEKDGGGGDELENTMDGTPPSLTARLWPPASGQLPRRCLADSASKGGRGGSRA